jgi:adenine-specific DNA-methyltransferase
VANFSEFLNAVDLLRLDANKKLGREQRSRFGQFMTPPSTAQLMASMFAANQETVSLLDAGAGVGSLTAAFVGEMCSRQHRPKSIHATVYEIDQFLVPYLADTLNRCAAKCREAGIKFDFNLIDCDFIDEGARLLRQHLLTKVPHFDCAILNPPYKKISSDSQTRAILSQLGIETSNLYAGFLSLALMLLGPGGEVVAITPRSFCNGPYFKPFRKLLLETITLRRVHLFQSRRSAFREDQVLQENIILHGIKERKSSETMEISTSEGPDGRVSSVRTNQANVVRTNDRDYFIRIVGDEAGASIAHQMEHLKSTLRDLNVEVSTGRVVDFRATKFTRKEPGKGTVPLIYPRNLDHGFVSWPKPGGKKPHAIAVLPGARELLVPRGTYVLVKRFSSKEEKRRVVAAIYDPKRIVSDEVGFENHINYFHRDGKGLPREFARGLAAFLNSSAVDLFFRQFNGHTQVNATDLRSLKYPSATQLSFLGSKIGSIFPDQVRVDELVKREIFGNEPEEHEVRAMA